MTRLGLFIAAPLVAIALAACGGDDEPATTSSADGEDLNPTTATIEASAAPDGSLAYEQESLDTQAGTVTATFLNDAPIAHDFCLEDSGGQELGCTDLVADGNTDIQEFELEPGEYTFYCSVAGHRDGDPGMEGTLTVKAPSG